MPTGTREPMRAMRVTLPPPPPKRLQVVNKTDEPVRPENPVPSTLAPVGLSRDGLLAIGIIALSVLVLILQFAAPWYSTDPFQFGTISASGQTVDRAEIKDAFEGEALYLRGLHMWPLAALIGTIIVGAGLLALDFLALDEAITRRARIGAILAAAYLGFILVLVGVRLFHPVIMEAWSGGGGTNAHVVPYADLVGGALIVAASVWALRRQFAGTAVTSAMRWTGALVLVAAFALVLDPLLPYVSVDTFGGGNEAHAGEWDLAAGSGEKIFTDFDLAFGMLWVTFYLATIGFLAAVAEREIPLRVWTVLVQTNALAAISIVVGAVFTILLYVHLGEDGPATLGRERSFNYVLAAAYAAMAGAYTLYALRVLRPFLGQSSRALSSPTPANDWT